MEAILDYVWHALAGSHDEAELPQDERIEKDSDMWED
jgi:hypothetical protein